MLINFFASIGSINPSADAGLAMNLKQQGESDANIVNAILSQDATLQSIQNKQNIEAANALANQAPEVAATKAAMEAATKEHAASGSQNVLIDIGGVTMTREQAANFAPTDVSMCADPDNPRGAKIPCTEANAKIKARELTTQSFNIASVSKVVAINGIPMENPTKPQMLGTVEPITDASKTLQIVKQQAQVDLTKTTTNPETVPSTPTPPPAPSDPIKQFIDGITALFKPVTKPASDVIGTAEKQVADALAAANKQVADLIAAGETAGSSALAAAQKQVADLIAVGQSQVGLAEKQAADALAAAEKKANELVTGAESNVADLIAKFTGAFSSFPDPTKQPPATVPPVTPPSPTPETKPPTQPETPKPTLKEQATAFVKKFAVPITLAAGATASLAIVLSVNAKHGVIAR